MNPIDYEINKELGECYLFMGEHEKARDYYNKAVQCDANKFEPYMGLAAIAVAEGELEAAYRLYTQAGALNADEKPLTGIGMVAMELGRHSEAFAIFHAILDRNPGNMMAINNLLQLGYVLQRLEDVVPRLEAALDCGDTEAVRYALSACFLALGRNDDARHHLELLLGDNPTNTGAKQLYAQLAA